MLGGLVIGLGLIVEAFQIEEFNNIIAGIVALVCCALTGSILWWDMNRRAQLQARYIGDRHGASQGVMMAHALNLNDPPEETVGSDGLGLD